jgi:hypothetical protein
MRNYDCASCPFVKKIKRVTKPMYLCTRGRYANTPDGGYPVAWIKKCDYDTEVKGVENENREK